jgi:Domain of unknown function (DUF4294)
MLAIRCMMQVLILHGTVFALTQNQTSGNAINSKQHADTAKYIYNIGNLKTTDSVPTVNLREVQIVTFKTQEEWAEYYRDKARIEKVMPYVKIARELYAELREKEDTSRRRDYRHYRKDLEKEMRTKFEKELKDLTTGQGEMLFKLINRETGNNCYKLIKDVKGPVPAWFAQMLARHWGYDLKENYDPEKEKMIELIIKQLGPNYKG